MTSKLIHHSCIALLQSEQIVSFKEIFQSGVISDVIKKNIPLTINVSINSN